MTTARSLWQRTLRISSETPFGLRDGGDARLAEIPEGRPLKASFWIGPEVSFEKQAPVLCGHAQFVVEWVKELDSVTGAGLPSLELPTSFDVVVTGAQRVGI